MPFPCRRGSGNFTGRVPPSTFRRENTASNLPPHAGITPICRSPSSPERSPTGRTGLTAMPVTATV
ncbi:MAG: hypothetical protein L6W00_28425 [Lentisphaeria bacterium]|nr:MAG: hypothetical protein L6W00_28425 [Lentisphaeria bacterium]